MNFIKLNNVTDQAVLTGAKYIGTGVACSGLIGAGVGVGLAWAFFSIACSHNPDVGLKNFKYAILGFALTEAVGLLALMVAFTIFFSQYI